MTWPGFPNPNSFLSYNDAMNEEHAFIQFRKYELLGGLIFLGIFLSGALAWALRLIVAQLVGLADPLRANLILNLGFDLLSLAVLIPLLHRWLAGQFRLLRAGGVKRTLRELLIGLGLILLALIVLSRLLSFVSILYPDYSNGNQENLEVLYAAYPVWITLMTSVTAPVIEELLFRGLIFCGLRPRSRFLAYFLSALAFAFPHVSAYLGNVPLPLSAVNLLLYFSMGLILARTCERSRTIFTPILLHAVYNTIMTFLIR